MKLHNTETIKKPRQQPVSVRFHKIPIYGIFHYLRVIKCNENGKNSFYGGSSVVRTFGILVSRALFMGMRNTVTLIAVISCLTRMGQCKVV